MNEEVRVCKTESLKEVLKRMGLLVQKVDELTAEVHDLTRRERVFPDAVMSVSETAAYFGVTSQTIRNWEKLHKIERVTIAGRTGFLRSALREGVSQ